MNSLLVIDGHNYLWRSYSVPFKFYSANKIPLHVVTTFLKQIRKAVEISQCTHIAIVFDTQSSNRKSEMLVDYKMNRKQDYSQDEDSPFLHLPYIKQSLEYLGINFFECPGIEADEVIATISTSFVKNLDGNCFIGSNDTDFFQLVCENVKIIKLGTKETHTLIDEDFILEKLNISPSQYCYHKSLTGDSADNISGVPGIGPVRATKIINNEFAFDLEPHKDLIERNLNLINLQCDHEIEINFENLTNVEAIVEMNNKMIFDGCGF